MNDSEIILHRGGTTLVGRDATMLFAAVTLRTALRLYARTRMKASRAYTPRAMLSSASTYTGKTYKRCDVATYEDAISDLDVWIATMKAALPVTDEIKEG